MGFTIHILKDPNKDSLPNTRDRDGCAGMRFSPNTEHENIWMRGRTANVTGDQFISKY